MSRQISEADWRIFRELRPTALERFCQRVLDEVATLVTVAEPGAHERYLAIYKLMRRRDGELAQAFDTPRRSTALRGLASFRSLRLLTEEELARFGPETREFLDHFPSNPHA